MTNRNSHRLRPAPLAANDEGLATIVDCLSPRARRELAALLANTLNIIDNLPELRDLSPTDVRAGEYRLSAAAATTGRASGRKQTCALSKP